jgi:hypothetical protein
MPTPSELQNERPRRSVFGNYRAVPAAAPRHGAAQRIEQPAVHPDEATLQSAIDSAVARTFLCSFLAKTFQDPEPETWRWLAAPETGGGLRAAAAALAPGSLSELAEETLRQMASSSFEGFSSVHMACFGHTVRGDCPMNEIEYGDIKADPLFQPHRLSDLGAFFAAFGLEVVSDAAERIDHISIELEFVSVLAAKEAHALEHQSDNDALDGLRDAQKQFLREHLGRWSPAFARRLARMAEGTVPGAVAKLLGEFIRIECARLKVPAGSDDLLLRPIDDSMERFCDQCGIHHLPPGAAMTGAKL